MMSTDARLAYMADQIWRNFAVRGDAGAAKATADHIASFWDPRMKARAFALLGEAGGVDFTPGAAAALTLLRDRGAPAHQTAATEFGGAGETGGSDAG